MAIVNGNAANNVLNGTAAADQIFGFAGNDVLNGLGGDDQLTGGLGSDTLNGGPGLDTANYDDAIGTVTVSLLTQRSSGALGVDTLSEVENLRGGPFDDSLTGDAAANVLTGLAGSDFLNGAGGNDVLNSGADDDTLRGDGGDDTLDGGAGLDLIDLTGATGGAAFTLTQSASETVANLSNVGLGVDTYRNIEGVIGSSFNDTLFGSSGDDVLNGAGGDDRLDGGGGDDEIDGGPGADTVIWNPGSGFDTVNGGPGGNTLQVSGTDSDDRFRLRPDGSAIVLDADSVPLVRITRPDTIEINGRDGNDSLFLGGAGGSVGDFITRLLGRVVFRGGDGTDLVVGANAGLTQLVAFGEGGTDVLQGGPADDTLDGGEGNDRIAGLGGADMIIGGPGDDSFIWSPGDGRDTVTGGADMDSQEVSGSANAGDGFSLRAEGGDVVLDTFQFDEDFIIDENTISRQFRMSGVEAIEINGQGGDDFLRIGNLSGTDLGQITVHGGADQDLITITSAGPVVAFGDEGADILLGSPGDDTLRGDNDAVNANPAPFASDDQLAGDGGNDRLLGDAGGDELKGGPGDDTLDGGTGIDFIDLTDATGGVTFTLTQAASETVANLSAVGLGTDNYRNMEGVIGTSFNDTLFGSPGDDVLNGFGGANRLFGGPGNDLLLGTGPGGDTFDGGTGNDVLDAAGDRNVFTYRQLFQVGGGLGGGADEIPFFVPGGMDRIVLVPFTFGVNRARSLLDSNGDRVLNDADRLVSVGNFDPDREGDELRIDFGGGNMLTVVANELRLDTEVTIVPAIRFPFDFLF